MSAIAPLSFLDSPFASRVEFERYLALAPEKREGFLKAYTAAAAVKKEAAEMTVAAEAIPAPVAETAAQNPDPEPVDVGDALADAASAAATTAGKGEKQAVGKQS